MCRWRRNNALPLLSTAIPSTMLIIVLCLEMLTQTNRQQQLSRDSEDIYILLYGPMTDLTYLLEAHLT